MIAVTPSLPLITVIVAVYNGAKTIQQCIDSVSGQSYSNKQLVIIDGASKDGSVDILKSNGDRVDYWISEADTGIYGAWNKALQRANGEWICFLGSDDFLMNSEVLSRMSSELVSIAQDINVVYGQVMLLSESGEELYAIGEPWGYVKQRFKQLMCIPHPGAMHRRSLFSINGNFDESFRIAADYEFLLRELKLANAVFVPGLVMAAMRQGGISSSPQNTIRSLKEVRRAQQKNGIPSPGTFWLAALARAYARLILFNVVGEKVARRLLDMGRLLIGLPRYWTKT
jgi:glycosyltransferase involved in cell wall biosynthesis